MSQFDDINLETRREKLRLKTIDYKADKDDVKAQLDEHVLTRHDLLVGNDCLRHMTNRQINMPSAINAKIFADRPRAQRTSMKRTPLDASIRINDGTLFRYGKRLMKQDHFKERTLLAKKAKEQALEDARKEQKYLMEKRSDHEAMYLHLQVKAEDYKSRLTSAKLIYQRLQKMHTELETHSGEFPTIIMALEKKIEGRQTELDQFKAIKAKAKKMLLLEEHQLKPLNKELSMSIAHFEKAIAHEKNELDERRKTSLGKFMAEREHHAFNYTAGTNIEAMKMKSRKESLENAHDRVIALMDAMLVSDIAYVVDCIIDQEEVTLLLRDEREKRLEENRTLKEDLARLRRNHQALRYDDRRQARMRETLVQARINESDQRSRYEGLDVSLRAQDRLLTGISLALHALFEKLRPIKLPMDSNLYQSDLIPDVEHAILKLTKMKSLVSGSVAEVSRVRPVMLHHFMESRVPPDSVRVNNQATGSSLQGFDSFEADQPGYVSREMVKQAAEESIAGNAKNKNKK